MAKIIGLPKLSPTMEEGTLARWAKNEGDPVEVDDLLAEVETDKAVMEFRSFDRGVLLKRLANEGDTLRLEAPVAIIGKEGEDVAALVEQAGRAGAGNKGAPPATSNKKAKEAPADDGNEEDGERAPRPKEDRAPARAEPPARGQGGRVLASPLVRRIAREHEIDLGGVRGSGPGGRVVKRDVDAMLARGGAPGADGRGRPAAPPSGPRELPREAPLSPMRKTIARRLTESKQTVPHFYLTIDVDAGPIWEARQQINAELEESGEKVSLNDILIKACAVALRRVPEVNASFAGDKILYHANVDISVAVAIPDGLLTPVVRDADQKGVLEIAREVRDLAARARERKLKPEEMTGGTFSISNLGMYGIEDFAAVINPPEGAILAVGSVREEPVVKNGQIVPGRRMRMTMSCDHRVVDGALGAVWLKALRGLLEQPLRMLL
jgi:pyruvate dehydrogenase E2 component (dihydrolipoamide acetyltransferase)